MGFSSKIFKICIVCRLTFERGLITLIEKSIEVPRQGIMEILEEIGDRTTKQVEGLQKLQELLDRDGVYFLLPSLLYCVLYSL